MSFMLTPRLLSVAEQVPRGARLTDVGTDHAYLPVWLLERGTISSAIATDLRPGPLSQAAETIARHGLETQVALRLGDGLAPVADGETDCVVIAGMGGETILRILAQAPWAREKVCVVQPMSSLEDLRSGLGTLGYRIDSERLAQEGRALYVSMTLSAGREGPLTPAECWVGRVSCHRDDPLWPRYLVQEQRRAQRALAGLRQSRKETDAPRRAFLEAVVQTLAEWTEG